MAANSGFFITLEGVEGAGKSTATEFITDYLCRRQLDYIVTREPGGTPIAEEIRELLLKHHSETMDPDAELLLFFAGRAQHIAKVIKPALQAGKLVLCDRFTDASYAYQGVGRNISSERVEVLEQWVLGDLRPDLTIVFDVSPEIGLIRAKKCSTLDRIESEKIDFFQRVRSCYLERAHNNQQRYRIVDGEKSLANVKKQLVDILDKINYV